MGIYVEDGEDEHEGVKITKVVEDSPADRCGLKSGDYLLYLNGSPIKDSLALLHGISHTVQGQSVKLELLVNKKVGEPVENKNDQENQEANKMVEVLLDKAQK
jgi:S1-C subfamily serine protease